MGGKSWARFSSGVRRWGVGTAMVMVAVVASVGCYPGAYPLDIFPEMHYQSSQRRLEPGRTSPPPGAVPVTGGRPAYTFAQAESLQNPVARNPQSMERARKLFEVNCATCHGKDGKGGGPVAAYFGTQEKPVDFSAARARGRTDGQLYWLITNGIGNMPAYAPLLSEDERWALVNAIREVQGQ